MDNSKLKVFYPEIIQPYEKKFKPLKNKKIGMKGKIRV